MYGFLSSFRENHELILPVMTNRGTAYIVYADAPDAEAALARIQDLDLQGRAQGHSHHDREVGRRLGGAVEE